MIESIEKPQESIRKNRNPHRVIPAKAGIQKRNATGIYRKKQKPPPRHSRAGGNPETQRGRTLSEKTETLTTVIPAQAGIQKRNATGIYQKKQKPHRPSFPQKRESSNTTTGIYRKKQKPPPTVIPAKAGIQQPKNHRNLSAKTETPTAVIPAKAGIQTRRHGNLPNKTVSLDSTS
ncbi:hypothetical protein NDI83_09005 [Neisseria meningitidis]|uniref:hypothetical protein n=1 Tax=Neisseria meningitidis TaxID=487 RepID=UPI00265F6E9C|nr:hypothetical protein [Neisseria meningitidis]MDO0903010.1 hypothetical protein [Neisseria meningitidis]